MGMLRSWWNRMRLRRHGDRFRTELTEEMQAHRELVERELRDAGVSPVQARREAGQRFGNSDRLREESWQVVDLGLSGVVGDVRFAARRLRRSPGFAAAAVLTLALGVGAVTVIFSVVYGVLVDPFPYRDVQTLVTPKLCAPVFLGCSYNSYSPSQFLAIEQGTHFMSGVTASTISDVTLTGSGLPQHVRGNYITPNTFNVLGVAPMLGRPSQESDVMPGHAEVALLSDRYWKTHFGASRSVIGRVLTLNGRPRVVIGVMPPRFLWRGGDVYLPIRIVPAADVEGERYFILVGRLKPGLTAASAGAEARAELTPLFQSFLRVDPHAFPPHLRVAGLMSFGEMFQSGLADTLYLLLGAVAVLLLIACVNVSSLMLARAVSREHEFAVRAALGASRLRQARTALAEALLLAVLAVPVALLLAWGGLAATLRMVPAETIPDEAKVSLNLPVLAVALGVVLLAVFVAGLAPAWQSARPRPAEALTSRRSSRSRGQRRLQRGFVVAEMALSLTLLTLAGLMIRNLLAVDRRPLPFAPDHTLMLRLELDRARYPTAEAKIAFWRELTARAQQLPGVRAASVDSEFPYASGYQMEARTAAGPQGGRNAWVNIHLVSLDYLRLANVHLLEGRWLNEREIAAHAPDAVVTEGFAKRFFPGQDALGQTFGVPGLGAAPHSAPKTVAVTVVGVTTDIARYPDYRAGVPAAFLPYTVAPNGDAFLVSTALPASQMVHAMEQVVAGIDPGQAVSDAAPLRHILDMYGYAGPRFTVALFGAFAVMALALAVIGIYGVFSFLAAERELEIGIRMALGAQRGTVVWVMLREACLLALAGVGAGLPLALAGVHLAASEVVSAAAFDPLALGVAACVLGVSAMAGVMLPALRAAGTDPVEVLRAG